jgi:hypothetical protein
MTTAAISEFRRPDGCFAKGVSGNPAGRPKGSRNRATLVAEALVEERAEPLTAKMIELAEAGDAALLRLFFNAIIPPARDAAVELDVPAGKELDFDEVFRVTARALFDGEITPDQALRIGRFHSLALRIKEQQSKQAYREAKLRLETQRREAAPVKHQYFSRRSASTEGETNIEKSVMAGRDPAIHAGGETPREHSQGRSRTRDVDGRDKPGHDDDRDQYFSSRRSVAASSVPRRPTPDTGLYFSRESPRAPRSRLYSSTAPGALLTDLAA